MEAILACHPALSLKLLDWVAISFEQWLLIIIRTVPIYVSQDRDLRGKESSVTQDRNSFLLAIVASFALEPIDQQFPHVTYNVLGMHTVLVVSNSVT